MLFSTSIYVTGLLLWIGNVAAVPLGNVNTNDVFYRGDTAIASSAAGVAHPRSRPILTRRSIFRRGETVTDAQKGHKRASAAHQQAKAYNEAAAQAHQSAADAWGLIPSHPEAPGRVKKHNEQVAIYTATANQHAADRDQHDAWFGQQAVAEVNPYSASRSRADSSALRAIQSTPDARNSEYTAKEFAAKHAGH